MHLPVILQESNLIYITLPPQEPPFRMSVPPGNYTLRLYLQSTRTYSKADCLGVSNQLIVAIKD